MSSKWQRDVQAFHEATGLPVGDLTAAPVWQDRRLRAELILEEAMETIEALGFNVTAEVWESVNDEPDWVGFIDGLCDLIYVACGAAVTMGIDLDPFWDEVQRANMGKAGGPVRADGKVLKPEGWRGPDIEGTLDRVLSSRDNA